VATSSTPKKPPEWPENVPILTAEFIYPQFWESWDGTRLCLLEWCRRTFDAEELVENPIFDEAYRVLRAVLIENVDGDTDELGVLDLGALFDADRSADIWAETMRRLGYDL
jgi:hypothetical protein